MARRTALHSIVSLVVLAACQESISAPGACPQFCPDSDIPVVDTLLRGSIARDSAFRGYIASFEATEIQLVRPDAGGIEVRSAASFIEFPARVILSPNDTNTVPVIAVDSFRIDYRLVRRRQDVDSIRLGIYRLPAPVDTTATFQSTEAFFQDSTLVGTILVPDSAQLQAMSVVVSPDSFPDFEADGRRLALGLRILGSQPAWVTVGTNRGSLAPAVQRFFKVDSAGTIIERSDARLPRTELALVGGQVPLGSDVLATGGIPSARSILRIVGIDEVLETMSVSRATLELIPAMPTIGPPGDSLIVQAALVGADFGRKSPLAVGQLDSLFRGAGLVAVGSTDTIRIDVTQLVRQWAVDSEAPRAVMLVSNPEGASITELRVHSSRGPAEFRPALRIIGIPPVGPARRIQ